MTLIFLLAPVLAWTFSESIKVLGRSVRARRLAVDTAGQYGGMPSTHSTVVGTSVFLVGWTAGFASGAFGVAVTLAFVVIIDALAFRRAIGEHARALNQLLKDRPDWTPLRERLWHSPAEVAGGVTLGLLLGWLLALAADWASGQVLSRSKIVLMD
jgi:acid phosphatase family membrane protein YuiD